MDAGLEAETADVRQRLTWRESRRLKRCPIALPRLFGQRLEKPYSLNEEAPWSVCFRSSLSTDRFLHPVPDLRRISSELRRTIRNAIRRMLSTEKVRSLGRRRDAYGRRRPADGGSSCVLKVSITSSPHPGRAGFRVCRHGLRVRRCPPAPCAPSGRRHGCSRSADAAGYRTSTPSCAEGRC